MFVRWLNAYPIRDLSREAQTLRFWPSRRASFSAGDAAFKLSQETRLLRVQRMPNAHQGDKGGAIPTFELRARIHSLRRQELAPASLTVCRGLPAAGHPAGGIATCQMPPAYVGPGSRIEGKKTPPRRSNRNGGVFFAGNGSAGPIPPPASCVYGGKG